VLLIHTASEASTVRLDHGEGTVANEVTSQAPEDNQEDAADTEDDDDDAADAEGDEEDAAGVTGFLSRLNCMVTPISTTDICSMLGRP
jgi:hypothetical protein